MDAAASLGIRFHVAQALSAWEEAGTSLIRDAQDRQEVRSSKFPMPLPVGDEVTLRQAYEVRFGRIDGEEEVPHKDYLAVKSTGIEKNHLVAEPLSEVDAGQDNVDAVVRQFRAEAAGITGRRSRTRSSPRYSPEASPRLRAGLGAWEKDDGCVIPRR